MFNCYVHGWSNPTYMCPTCHPIHLQTTSGTQIYVKSNVNIYPDISILERKLEIYKKALENLDKMLGAHCLVSADFLRPVIQEALKEAEEIK